MNVLNEIAKYNVEWNSPSKSDRGYMPLGNGNTVMNLWAEEGKLCFYFTRQDTLTEADRNVTMGKMIIRFKDGTFSKDFKQTLDITTGVVTIKSNDLKIEVFVGLDEVIYVSANFELDYEIKKEFLNWRNEDFPLMESEDPDYAAESADIVENKENGILFYNKNGNPCINWHLKKVELPAKKDITRDWLSDRIFGGFIKQEKTATSYLMTIATGSEQTKNSEAFLNELISRKTDAESAKNNLKVFWQNYWQQSYVFVSGDQKKKAQTTKEFDQLKKQTYDNTDTADSKVTEAYILTKYMFYCNAKGLHPIRYNCLNHLVSPAYGEPFDFFKFAESLSADTKGEPTMKSSPDQRPWGDFTLLQNARLPYYSMLARGEYEEIKTLFNYYMGFSQVNKLAAKEYYDAQGQYNTEITMSFGCINAHIYGLDRTGKSKGYAENRWGGALDISPALELITLMLDYVLYTSDNKYLTETVIPYAKDIYLYISTRFKERKNGKIVLSPLHVLETYHDTANPLPIIAEMRANLNRLLKTGYEEEFFAEMLEITPEIIIKDEKFVLAEVCDDHRQNVEWGELYPTYPFRLCGVDEKGFQVAPNSYEDSKKHSNFRPYVIGEAPGAPFFSGWQYVGMAAARMANNPIKGSIQKTLKCNASVSLF